MFTGDVMKSRKTESKRTALNAIKNHKAAWFTGTVAAAGIAIFLFAKSCGGPLCEDPLPYTPTRGDRICEQVEAYPYQLNADGTIRQDEEGRNLLNPYYSKEDCHKGDNVCDTSAGEVRDPEGNLVTNLMSAYVDGTGVPSPLEDENSPDCIMQLVRDNPCAALAEDESNRISLQTRARITDSTDLGRRQRTRAELVSMHENVTAVQLGDNYFVVENGYQESCDASLPICTPDMTEECSCPNHEDCAPDDCGNGTVEEGEECDPASRQGRRACRGGTTCSRACQCVDLRRCGNGRVEGNEQCDPGSEAGRSRCGENSTCARDCTCHGREPVPECGNGRVDPGEDCDSSAPNSSCGSGERCNSSCECEEHVDPQVGQCPGNRVRNSDSLISRISGQVSTASGTLRDGLGASRVPVTVTVTVNISASGVPSLRGASARCGGSSCPQQPNLVSLAGLDLSGISTGIPTNPCYMLVPVQLR